MIGKKSLCYWICQKFVIEPSSEFTNQSMVETSYGWSIYNSLMSYLCSTLYIKHFSAQMHELKYAEAFYHANATKSYILL